MAITSTVTVDKHEQRGGGYCAIARYTDSSGFVHVDPYGPVPANFDHQARLASRAVQLGELLGSKEFEDMVREGVWRALVHNTADELAARFRAAYRDATGIEAARLAWWLIVRITAGNVTDARVRTAFGLTANQYTALKTRLTTLHGQYAAAFSARGE